MKTVSAPVTNFVKDGSLLTNWLGTFWLRIYENPELARNLQYGQGLLSAQLYLNFIESLNLRDRNNVPVFHRERWKPMVIRRSEAGTGRAALLKLGMDPAPVIGPQTGSGFVQDQVLEIGGHAEFASAVSYPLEGVADVITCITDNILAPNVVLIRGIDFIVRENTIFFLRNNEPFGLDAFPRRTVVDTNGDDDEEILLWGHDVLIDEEWVYEYLGYVLGLHTLSTEFYQGMVNGLWDLYNQGTPLSLLKAGIGALLGEPTVLHTDETVDIILEEDELIKVITDKEVYAVPDTATLRAAVVPGAVLHSGDFLTETVRLYETLNPLKLEAVSEYGERLRDDVQSLFLNRYLFRAPLQFGVGASWELSNIVNTGFDANGNPKLKFDLYGNEEDIDTFWADFWAYLESKNLSSETCFEEYLDDIVLPVEGAVYGRVSPLEYMMRYFLSANAFIVVVERSKLTGPPEDRDPVGLLNLLQSVLPAHVMMFVVEHRDIGPEEYNLAELTSAIEAHPALTIQSSAQPGGPSKVRLTYKDRPPKLRWISQCRD